MEHYYLLIKSLHLIAVMSWMAGMLYLPRLFVYHVDAIPGGELDKTLQAMERRLLRFIINPAMILSLIFGGVLIHITHVFDAQINGHWFHAKAGLLILLFASHGIMAKCRKQFAKGENKHSKKFYKILNEVPTVLMIAIVILAVMKPF